MSELSLDPTDWLPHRPPFLFLDILLSLEPGVRASAQWTLVGDEWFFPGHFPGRPTTPGVLLIESIAQCGAVVVLATSATPVACPSSAVSSAPASVVKSSPGDTVRIECEMTKLSARGGKGFGTATVDGDLAASTELFFVLADLS